MTFWQILGLKNVIAIYFDLMSFQKITHIMWLLFSYKVKTNHRTKPIKLEIAV